eukprot:14603991-Heterocapsa_arctica.AAC.1
MARGEQIMVLLAAHNLIECLGWAEMNPVIDLVIASASRTIRHHFQPIGKAGLLQFCVDLQKMRKGYIVALDWSHFVD